MRNDIFERLKASKVVLKLKSDESLFILTNVDNRNKSKVYGFIYHDGTPLLTEITDEDILLDITKHDVDK